MLLALIMKLPKQKTYFNGNVEKLNNVMRTYYNTALWLNEKNLFIIHYFKTGIDRVLMMQSHFSYGSNLGTPLGANK